MTYDLVLRSRRTVTPDGERPASVAIAAGRIAAVAGYHDSLPAAVVRDLGEMALLPGMVDTHVHVNEPGRTHWEGFATATRAALAGGITTIVDMPLNSLPPTVDPAALETKRRAAAGRVYTDVGFWGGAVPGNLGSLAPLHKQGVFGFKCFTSPSGVTEFPPLRPDELDAALAEAAAIDALVIVHAEDPQALTAAPPPGRTFAEFAASRPVAAEVKAVRAVLAAAERTGAKVHLLHLSSAESAAEIAAARRRGIAATAETCPHYLCLAAEDVPDGATDFKCCPPIRDKAGREELWAALADGAIDCVVSDHSPCPPELKEGDFGQAWGGIASVQLGLPLMWTHARERGLRLSDVVAWMAAGPARIAGLERKGRIEVGADADLVAFAPDHRWTVRAADLHHRHPITPYEGARVTGAVAATWLRGRRTGRIPTGKLLSKED